MTTVVLADDEVLLRKALASLLPLEGEITVLAEAEDGEGRTSHPATPARRPRHRPGNYLSNAMQKTQTRTRHEAVRYAREHDWL